MNTQRVGIQHNDGLNIPMIDGEFDRFELNHDLETDLRQADAATFYHDACNPLE